jgi:hypothetical protein
MSALDGSGLARHPDNNNMTHQLVVSFAFDARE